MEIAEYEGLARRTVNPALEEPQRLMDAAAGLAEESGEVLGMVRKHVYQGRALSREQILLELGDALWCLTIVATSAGLTLDQVARANIEKLYQRHPDGFRPQL